MKYAITFFLSLVAFTNSFSQLLVKKDTSYNKWICAVINIETRAGNDKALSDSFELVRQGKVTMQNFQQISKKLVLTPPAFTATAILLKYHGKNFLLTARHVLHDPTGLYSNTIFNNIILVENDSFMNKNLPPVDSFGNIYRSRNDTNTIYIPSLWDYGATYLSSIKDDIGMIFLDFSPKTRRFLRTLIERGYKPIEITDIDTSFSAVKNDKLFCIGFPSKNDLLIKYREKTNQQLLWESNVITTRVISKGTYESEYPKKSNFFDANVFVYKGFSGGPVISKGRLIGIISAVQDRELFSTGAKAPFKVYFLNRSKFIKSSLILPLLRKFEVIIKSTEESRHRYDELYKKSGGIE